MNRRRIFWLWLPLAVSFTLMMLEGPTVQAAITRLDQSALNLAAFGLVMSISLIIESPVIMLISTAIALVRDAQSYRILRTFVITLNLVLTVVTALVAWTPLYGLVVGGVLGIPATIAAAARPAFQIMLLWTAAIGWRRFYQGILVRHGLTTRVSYGTAIRLFFTIVTAAALAVWGRLPGAIVGACSLMAGVISEAIATHLFALPVVRRIETEPRAATEQPLTISAIIAFHMPLAATSLLTLVVQPVTAAALARLAQPTATLATWPVIFSAMMVLRGWGMALQETAIAQAADQRAQRPLRDFTLIVAAATSLAALLLAFTPALDLYLRTVISLDPQLWSYVRGGLQVLLLLPGITALTSWLRGLLVAAGTTSNVYRGMGVNLVVNGSLLLLGVAFQLPGILVAAVSLIVASAAEYLYLQRRYNTIAEERRARMPAKPATIA
ncbi:MAG: hypothetical protein JOZ51_07675 [Chloroflexi bacterium]|nr:hypothetical protein [Chloroflexota bacterium]